MFGPRCRTRVVAHDRIDPKALPPGRVGSSVDPEGNDLERGGRWQVSFLVRHQQARDVCRPKPHTHRGGIVGVDVGIRHLATLSEPAPGLTDEHGHIANPRVLDAQLHRLRRLDRAIARCVKGSDGRWSNNRRQLVDRRARLHGRITKTRRLSLHAVSNLLPTATTRSSSKTSTWPAWPTAHGTSAAPSPTRHSPSCPSPRLQDRTATGPKGHAAWSVSTGSTRRPRRARPAGQ